MCVPATATAAAAAAGVFYLGTREWGANVMDVFINFSAARAKCALSYARAYTLIRFKGRRVCMRGRGVGMF